MSYTPRTDAIVEVGCTPELAVVPVDFARALERDLIEAQSELLAERIKRETAERRLSDALAEADRLLSALALIAINPDNALSPKLIATNALAREE